MALVQSLRRNAHWRLALISYVYGEFDLCFQYMDLALDRQD